MAINWSLYRKISKYGLFGVITAGIELGVFIAIEPFSHIYAASLISFLAGLVSSFLFNKFLVFKNTDRATKKEATQFIVLGLVNSQLSSLVTWILAAVVPNHIAKIISMVLIAAWNYLIMNFVIFRKKQTLERLDQ